MTDAQYAIAIWVMSLELDPEADKRELCHTMFQMGVEDGPEGS